MRNVRVMRRVGRSLKQALAWSLAILALLGATGCSVSLPGSGDSAVQSPTPSIIYQNPLTSAASGWDNAPGTCFFGPGGYHVSNNYACYAPAGVLTDVGITVDVMQLAGLASAPYGIIVRQTKAISYEFDITSGGEWQFVKCTNGTCSPLVPPTLNSAIKPALKSSNTLEVRATQKHFDFWVNSINVGQVDDTGVYSGRIALAVSKNMESVFTNITITKFG
ncbi:MAG TPA: hypothetical protein VH349_09380 [Ktedonobacterales bacterium]